MPFFKRIESYLQPRDHTDHTDVNGRACIRAIAVKEFGATDNLPTEFYNDCYFEFAHNIAGDDRGADAWSFASPVQVTEKIEGGQDKKGLLPIRNQKLDDDTGYKIIEEAAVSDLFPVTIAAPPVASVAAPPGIKDYDTDKREYRSVAAPMPKGTAGILLAGSEEKSQHNLLHPSWQGVTIADHRSKEEPRFSTRVADLSPTDNSVDPQLTSGLDTVFKVIRAWAKNAGIAEWKGIDPKRLDIGRGLFETDGLFGASDRPRLGYGSESGGGVHSAGAGLADRHLAGETGEGDPIAQGHINANVPIFVNAIIDAPREYDGRLYEKAGFAGQPQEVHVRYDPQSAHIGMGKGGVPVFHQGLIRAETFTPIYVPPPPPKRPPEIIPRFPSEPLVAAPRNAPKPPLDPFDPSELPESGELDPDGSPLFSRKAGVKAQIISRGPRLDPDERSIPGTRQPALEDIDNKRNIRTRALIYNEIGVPSIAFKAICHGDDRADLRYKRKPSAEDVERYFTRAPLVAVLESYGAKRSSEFILDNEPGSTRDAHGDVSGGLVLKPPQRSLDGQFTDGTTSTTYLVFDGTRSARGTPILTGTNAGGVADGFSDYLDTANDRWVTYHHDSDGNATLVREYDAQGRDRKLCLATYGDGRDGGATISSTTTYTENKFFENLELNASQTVIAKNLGIFVKDTLTIGASAVINANGESGESGTEGGVAGGGAAANYYGESGGGGDGNVGAAGSAGSAPGPSLGGNGGDGGSGEGGANAGGSGGSVSAPDHWPAFLEAILMGLARDLSAFSGGGGGGGGGAGAGVQGAGGGGGAGVLLIVARHLVLDTTGGVVFTAIGGRGGDGATTNSGGAGGGGGGFVCVVYQTAEDHEGNQLSKAQVEALISVAGADGGALNGTGGKGNPGSNGNKIVFKHG